jgi:tRNA 2-thiocytidine biosynthesis protein TtcA
VYVQEKDIIDYAVASAFPIIPCNLCGSQENLSRKRIAKLIETLATDNPKVPSNLLHALQSVKPSQLMDQDLWNFRHLEKQLLAPTSSEESIDIQQEYDVSIAG